jgi:hypothetical protein
MMTWEHDELDVVWQTGIATCRSTSQRAFIREPSNDYLRTLMALGGGGERGSAGVQAFASSRRSKAAR